MAAAGVSPIGVVDYDTVDLSNLHRQILHTEQKKVGKVYILKSPTFALTAHTIQKLIFDNNSAIQKIFPGTSTYFTKKVGKVNRRPQQ